MSDFGSFLRDFEVYQNFTFLKINHRFWEYLAMVEERFGWPVDPVAHPEIDAFLKLKDYFEGGYIPELLELLEQCRGTTDPSLNIAFGLSAWTNDDRLDGKRVDPVLTQKALDRFSGCANGPHSGLVLKIAIENGQFEELLAVLRHHPVLLVGPSYIGSFNEFAGIDQGAHLEIHGSLARQQRFDYETRIADKLDRLAGEAVVLMQAGTLAPWFSLRLRSRFPNARWIDAGLALSICHPQDLLERPWGKIHRPSIARLYNRVVDRNELDEFPRLPAVEKQVRQVQDNPPAERAIVRFVPVKIPDEDRIARFLSVSRAQNQWANGGPLYNALARSYEDFMGIGDNLRIIPCANAGVGLEVLARLLDSRSDEPLKWAISAFTFKNLGRGYFHDAEVIDCNQEGMIEIDALETVLQSNRANAFVLTNVFGIWTRYQPFIELARRTGAHMIIDNAAGIRPDVPEWPYQVFSLHQTKPYGFGEGGMVLLPAESEVEFIRLINYADIAPGELRHWFNNGKLSEVACAYHLERLESSPQWVPYYELQALRVRNIALRAGFRQLFQWQRIHAATSLPFLAPGYLDRQLIRNDKIVFGHYYEPIKNLPVASDLYRRILNIPSHPDVAGLTEKELHSELERIAGSAH